MAKKMGSGRSDYGYGHPKTNDVTTVGVNDEDDFLEVIHEGTNKKTGNVPGKKMGPNYGKESGESNRKYNQRGTWSDDDKKLAAQAMPDDRKYSYLQ